MKSCKALLIQIRNTENIKAEEFSSFSKNSTIPKNQFEILDVFANPGFKGVDCRDYDCVFVGGASEASVLDPDKYPFVKRAQEFLLECIGQDIPVFASCFGFQLAVLALGGEILKDDKDFEMGSIPIQLTEAAKSDNVFKDTPNNFMAISVHQEKAIKAPENCELLAYTDACIHSFKVIGRRFWAFQFHPEVDRETLVNRLTYYKHRYTQGSDHLQEVIDCAEETPYSQKLVFNFTKNVLKYGN